MDRLDGTAVHAWAAAATTALGAARARVDAVNVFPVADSDTGTNVHLTVAGGAEAVATARSAANGADGADAVARTFARGALLAARGNSGVIVSQYLAGLAGALPPAAGPQEVARALTAAAAGARDAVAEPQEGTVLTLARVVAEAASAAAGSGAALGAVLGRALAEGHAALDRISAEHPVLRAAHVVDAGACALLVLLDALGRVVAGEAEAEADLAWLPTGTARAHGPGDPGSVEGTDGRGAHGEPGGGAYEVMLLVRTAADATEPGDLGPELSARMQELGDSVAVVGGDGLWHVHVHTDDPGRAVVRAALGSRDQVVVRLLADRAASGLPTGLGVVACTGSVDLAAGLASLGAVTLVRCDGASVSERHLVRAVTDTGDAHVVVLPGDDATAELARRCAPGLRAAGVTLEVLPALDELRVTVGALALAGSDAGPGDRVRACLRSLDGLRVAAVSGPAPGPAREAVDALLAGPGGAGGAETLTLLTGCDVTAEARAELEAHVAERHPQLTVLGAGPADGVPSYWMGVE